MNTGQTVFSQLISHLPMDAFRRCVRKYRGNHKVQSFSCLDQFLCLVFAQLTYRNSLRDIVSCLRARKSRLYHMGIRGTISRSTLADANEKRDWRIYAEFAQRLIPIARKLYQNETFIQDLDETVYALDSTTIDLCLSIFPWANYRPSKGAIKLHTLLDLRGNIPVFIRVTDGLVHDINVLDVLLPEPGAYYVMDRGYVDFRRLYQLHQARSFYVIRAKANLKYKRIYSAEVDRDTGLVCDQTIKLTIFRSAKEYPEKLRRIRFYDQQEKRTLVFLTNNFQLPAMSITQLYKSRWKIELFFKWIKKHLRIKSFYGTSPNAVKTQIWTAITVYLMVAIVKKRLDLGIPLYTFLQILSVSVFEKVDIFHMVTEGDYRTETPHSGNQLNLFDL